jgi:hypothetical protein
MIKYDIEGGSTASLDKSNSIEKIKAKYLNKDNTAIAHAKVNFNEIPVSSNIEMIKAKYNNQLGKTSNNLQSSVNNSIPTPKSNVEDKLKKYKLEIANDTMINNNRQEKLKTSAINYSEKINFEENNSLIENGQTINIKLNNKNDEAEITTNNIILDKLNQLEQTLHKLTSQQNNNLDNSLQNIKNNKEVSKIEPTKELNAKDLLIEETEGIPVPKQPKILKPNILINNEFDDEDIIPMSIKVNRLKILRSEKCEVK